MIVQIIMKPTSLNASIYIFMGHVLFIHFLSLGGNCMTTMIATCSVEKKNIEVSTNY